MQETLPSARKVGFWSHFEHSFYFWNGLDFGVLVHFIAKDVKFDNIRCRWFGDITV